jgi:hypothetical protein
LPEEEVDALLDAPLDAPPEEAPELALDAPADAVLGATFALPPVCVAAPVFVEVPVLSFEVAGAGAVVSCARAAWLKESADKVVRIATARLMGVRGLMIFLRYAAGVSRPSVREMRAGECYTVT